jgi:hypothetical protein
MLLAAVLLSGSAKAQRVVYSNYEPYDLRSSDMAIVGKVNGILYTFRSYNNDYFLEGYNDVMEKQATVILDFFPSKIYRVRFVPFEQEMLVLYQAVDGTRITQYAAMLDEAGRLKKGPLRIDEQRSGFLGSTASREYFASAVSENRQHIVIYSPRIKNRQLEFKAYWLDPQQFKVTKRHKLKFKGGNYITNGEGLLSNSGQFYLPVYTQIGNRDFSDEYVLLGLKKEDAAFGLTRLQLEDKYLEYPFQRMDNVNNKIYLGAFYSRHKNGNNEGVLAATFDMAAAAYTSSRFIPYSEQLRSETGSRNKQRALNDFRINQLVIRNDGGFVLAAEEYFVTNRTSYMPGLGFYSFYYTPMMSQNIREYHFNDILVMSYTADGNPEWHSFIRKEQYSQEDGGMFSSYSMLNTGGGLGFLFNDFNSKRSRIQLSTLDSSGVQSSGFMDAGNQDDPDWLPRSGKQVAAREIIVPCLRKKQICFAKIVL